MITYAATLLYIYGTALVHAYIKWNLCLCYDAISSKAKAYKRIFWWGITRKFALYRMLENFSGLCFCKKHVRAICVFISSSSFMDLRTNIWCVCHYSDICNQFCICHITSSRISFDILLDCVCMNVCVCVQKLSKLNKFRI